MLSKAAVRLLRWYVRSGDLQPNSQNLLLSHSLGNCSLLMLLHVTVCDKSDPGGYRTALMTKDCWFTALTGDRAVEQVSTPTLQYLLLLHRWV